MLYLYLGYLITKLHSFYEVLSGVNFVWSIYIFSFVVFLAFSFFPVLGYSLAKLVGAYGTSNRLVLIASGLTVGLMEMALVDFNIIAFGDGFMSELAAFFFMFIAAFIPFYLKTLFNKRTEQV